MSEMYLLIAIVWLVLEFTKFARTRKIVALIGIIFISLHSVDMAIYRGKTTHIFVSRMKLLSQKLEQGEIEEVRQIIKSVSSAVDSGKDISLAFMEQEHRLFSHIPETNGNNNDSQQSSPPYD